MSGYSNKPNIDIVFKLLTTVEVEKFVSVQYLAKKLEYSDPTIKCAGRALFKLGLLETKKGTGGGYRLKRRTSEIFLSELSSLIEHERHILQVTFKESGHLTVSQIMRKNK